MMKKYLLWTALICALVLTSFSWVNAASASAVIKASASNSNPAVNEKFTVTISVDGGGAEFTTFGAKVALKNLTVVKLTKGTDVKQWTKEPTATSLDFYGGVTGKVGSVTVYQLEVQATAEGAAAVTISEGSVKSTDGFSVTEILKSQSGVEVAVGNGSVTPTTPEEPTAPVEPQTESDTTTSSVTALIVAMASAIVLLGLLLAWLIRWRMSQPGPLE